MAAMESEISIAVVFVEAFLVHCLLLNSRNRIVHWCKLDVR